MEGAEGIILGRDRWCGRRPPRSLGVARFIGVAPQGKPEPSPATLTLCSHAEKKAHVKTKNRTITSFHTSKSPPCRVSGICAQERSRRVVWGLRPPTTTMSVLLETSLGDLVIDLLVDASPKACEK